MFGNPTSKHPLNYLSTPLTALTTLSNKPVFNYLYENLHQSSINEDDEYEYDSDDYQELDADGNETD